MSTLRPYQEEIIAAVREEFFEKGTKRVLVQSPTGSGKTILIGFIAGEMHAGGKRLAICTHLVNLIPQIAKALDDAGLSGEYGVIAGGYPKTDHAIQIISVDSWNARGMTLAFDLVIVDEAHHLLETNKWGKVVQSMPPDTLVLGVTATPQRGDGSGLTYFQVLILGPTEEELIEQGYLVEPEIYCPPTGVTLVGVGTRGGDYKLEEIERIMDRPKITGSAIEHYLELANGLPAVAFTTTVAHAYNFARECRLAGVTAAVIEGKMPKAQIAATIQQFARGEIKILAACNLISEGLDLKSIGGPGAWVGCVIVLRPTKSLALWRQIAGRGMRKEFPEKLKVILLDCVGNTLRAGLGMPHDAIDWKLEGRKKSKKGTLLEATIPVLQCPKCYKAMRPVKECKNCGFIFAEEITIKQIEGKLQKLTKDEMAVLKQRREELLKNAKCLQDLYDIAAELRTKDGKPYKPDWADQIYIYRNGHNAWLREKARMKRDKEKGVEFEAV